MSDVLTPRREPGTSGGLAGLGACSACVGDYEDPDRTAWTHEESDQDEDESAFETMAKKLPDEN